MVRSNDLGKMERSKTTHVALWLALPAVLVLMLFLCPLGDWPVGGAEAASPQVFIVYLRDQPQVAVAEAVNAEFAPRLQALSQQAEAADRALRPVEKCRPLKTRDEEVACVERLARETPIDPQAQQARDGALAALSDTREEMSREILARSAGAQERSQAEAVQVVEQLGGRVIYHYHTVNGLAVLLPPDQAQTLSARLGNVPVFEDRLMQGDLNISVTAMAAPYYWSMLGNAGGLWDIGIIDSGVEVDHPALQPHGIVQGRFLAAAEAAPGSQVAAWEPDSPDIIGGIRDRSGHGTHVAGIVSSRDATFQGVAHDHRYIISGKAGFSPHGTDNTRPSMDWADAMDATDWALNFAEPYRADVVNLSYSLPSTADDDGFAQFWDAVVDQWNVFVALSAGNRNQNGSPTIGTPSFAYNAVTVASVDDRNTTSIADDVIAGESSRGPTLLGRKKPDLSAPGTDIASCDNSYNSGDDFISMSGTSMAAPHVAGAALLMLSRRFLDPMSMKALLINSARDMGDPGRDPAYGWWDPAYGWGHVDLANLWNNFDNRFVDVTERDDPATDAEDLESVQFFDGNGSTGNKATLVWHRRAMYNGHENPALWYGLTNLDLFLYRRNPDTLLDSSESDRDNVEQVRWVAADNLPSVLKVHCKSTTILGQRTERYVLATPGGFVRRAGPGMVLAPLWIDGNPWGPPETTYITLGAVIVNTGDLPAHNVMLYLGDSEVLSLVKGEPDISVGTLDPGQSSPQFYWVFQKITADWPELNLTAESNSYGMTFSRTEPFFRKAYLPLILK